LGFFRHARYAESGTTQARGNPMTGEAVLWLIAIFYFTTIALILLELQRVLRRICLAIEQNASPVKATSEKLDGLAGLNENQL
jgi:hypothetical protein